MVIFPNCFLKQIYYWLHGGDCFRQPMDLPEQRFVVSPDIYKHWDPRFPTFFSAFKKRRCKAHMKGAMRHPRNRADISMVRTSLNQAPILRSCSSTVYVKMTFQLWMFQGRPRKFDYGFHERHQNKIDCNKCNMFDKILRWRLWNQIVCPVLV